MSRPKSEQPETLREAQTWTKFNHEHIRSGLCHPCASQAATGRQIGFSKVRPPCSQECRSGSARVPALSRWSR